jgi:hypothetical protein
MWRMFFFLCSMAGVTSVTMVIGALAGEVGAVPNFMSADYGWLPNNVPQNNPAGLYFLPVPGKVTPVGADPHPRGVGADGQPVRERLSDADNPNLKPWAAAQMRMHNDLVRNGHRAFNAQSRCWPGGVPGQLLFVAEPVYFIQTPQEVWILWQRDHTVRRIYLNREHTVNPKPSWFGESVGYYEKGELVIDTIGFVEHRYSFVDNYRTPHTKDLHVVERWKMLDGGNAIEATVTVEDPGAFKAPWSGLVRWTKINGSMEETACAENNLNYEKFLHLREYPMPEAKTLDF